VGRKVYGRRPNPSDILKRKRQSALFTLEGRLVRRGRSARRQVSTRLVPTRSSTTALDSCGAHRADGFGENPRLS